MTGNPAIGMAGIRECGEPVPGEIEKNSCDTFAIMCMSLKGTNAARRQTNDSRLESSSRH